MSQDSLSALVNPSVFNELIAGSVGGAAQVLVGQPLDTIKTRAQIAPKGMFVSDFIIHSLVYTDLLSI
ncbi:hypothetical protein FRB91_004376 [Serendipita sp. 411]|nr:hypothetical protein FRB91_004376 [Serendipita sp. 411]